MSELSAAASALAAIDGVTVLQDAPFALQTRFAIGGAAAVLCDSGEQSAFVNAFSIVQERELPFVVISGGSNLVVSDAGFEGVALRFSGARISQEGERIEVEAGAVLQHLVDFTIDRGLEGMQTLTGIPGNVGGAIYGNAGAYGHSMEEIVERVTFTDGSSIRHFVNEECQFRYRESIFKERKDWVILSAQLRLHKGDPLDLRKAADEIRPIRDKKYPPTMKCAGSIFKNVFLADLPQRAQAEVPPNLVRDGKVPSAWFLEQTGVKGMRRGDIQVAPYHANLIYNDGNGTAMDLVAVIEELKRRVKDRFGFELEEEVQYVGFDLAGVVK